MHILKNVKTNNMRGPVIEDYSKLSKRELEVLARKYGVELDRRLRKDTLIRIVESTIENHNKEQDMLEDPLQKFFLRGIFVGVIIGAVATTLLAIGLKNLGL
jgi:hypothetical protein